MAQVPASSHGATFNGGAITTPLEIDQGASAASDQVLFVKDSGGNVVFGITPDGRMILFSNGTRQQATLTLSDNTPGNAGTLTFDSFSGVILSPEASANAVLALLPLTGHTGPLLQVTAPSGAELLKIMAAGSIGFFGHTPAGQPLVAAGSVTPEGIATALQGLGIFGVA